jgi:hypothetical protein
MAFVRSLEELVRVLAQGRVAHALDAAAHELELPSHADLPGGLVIRWETRVPFVSVRHLLFDNLPVDRTADLETAVARVNHHIDVSGFNLDHLRRRLYYRVSIPAFAGVDSDDLNRVAKGVIANAREFAPAFGAVIAGRAGAEVAQIYKDLAQSRAAHFA